MIGTALNTGAILLGGLAGLRLKKDLSPPRQLLIKQLLGIYTVITGLGMVWSGLNGSIGRCAYQFLLVLLAMIVGKMTGRGLRLQRASNRLGQYAKKQCASVATDPAHRASNGFVTCALLFCLQPLAVLGCLQEGLMNSVHVLVIKSIMDGLTTMALARGFGWGVLLSALPVLAYQGTLTLIFQGLAPVMQARDLLDALAITGGLLVFSVAAVILDLKKIELSDYLPSLALAPLFTWWWR